MAETEFKVNDKVVHPQYGGGFVDGIETIEVGEEPLECLKIRCVSKSRKIFVPKGSVELSAIRPPLKGKQYKELKDTLQAEPEEMNRNFNRRMKVVKTKLESGDPLKVAEVLRDMYPKWSDNSLSSSDQRIFEKCRDLLVSELALIEDLGYEEADQFFEKTMENGAAAKAKKNGG